MWMNFFLQMVAIFAVIGLVALFWAAIARYFGVIANNQSMVLSQLRHMVWICLALSTVACVSGAAIALHFPAVPALLKTMQSVGWQLRYLLVGAYFGVLLLIASIAMVIAHYTSYRFGIAAEYVRYFALCASEASLTIACVQLLLAPGSVFCLLFLTRFFQFIQYPTYLRWIVFAALIGLFGAVQYAFLDTIGESIYTQLMQLIRILE